MGSAGHPSGWMLECDSESGLIRMIWKILGKSPLWCLISCVTSTEPKDARIAGKALCMGVSVRMSREEISI